MEVNSMWWLNGTNVGKKHTLLTPGLLCGKFPINDCIRSAFRAGTQIAVTANSR
jgi:hypothetical protein